MLMRSVRQRTVVEQAPRQCFFHSPRNIASAVFAVAIDPAELAEAAQKVGMELLGKGLEECE